MTNESKLNNNTSQTNRIIDIEKKVDHLYDLIVNQKVLEKEKYSIWNKYISLGMAYQAFVVAGLTWFKLINPIPSQQFLSGLIFLGFFVFSLIIEKRKIL